MCHEFRDNPFTCFIANCFFHVEAFIMIKQRFLPREKHNKLSTGLKQRNCCLSFMKKVSTQLSLCSARVAQIKICF